MKMKNHISFYRTNEEGTACEECVEGYELNEEGYCNDINYCEEKVDGKCVKCKSEIGKYDNYYCANEIFGCLENSSENCIRCDNLNNLYECTKCKEGYKSVNNDCEKIE